MELPGLHTLMAAGTPPSHTPFSAARQQPRNTRSVRGPRASQHRGGNTSESHMLISRAPNVAAHATRRAARPPRVAAVGAAVANFMLFLHCFTTAPQETVGITAVGVTDRARLRHSDYF